MLAVRLESEVKAGLRGRLLPGDRTLGCESIGDFEHSSMGREGGPRESGSRAARLNVFLEVEVTEPSFNITPPPLLDPSGLTAEPNEAFDS